MRARLLLVALVLAASSVPLGAAEWGARGSHEPDTWEDRHHGLMFQDAPRTPLSTDSRIYFNAWAGHGSALALSANPNSATLGSGIMQAPYRAFALLGVWRDCNGDGFVGLGDNALLEYRTLLLNRTDICPPSPTNVRVHNDGAWVREFLPIGPNCDEAERARVARGEMTADRCLDTNPHNLVDETALVWADFKRPGEPPDLMCPVTPPPTGTLQSTGGMLRWIDCMDNWQVTGTWNAVAHAAGQHHLAFDDAPYHSPHESRSPLNRPNPYGAPQDAPAASAFDCSRGRMRVNDPVGVTRQQITDPTGGHLWPIFGPDGTWELYLSDENRDIHLVAPPRSAPTVDPAGSPAGTVNETESALGDCRMHEARNCGSTAHVGADQHTGGDVYCLVEDQRPITLRDARRKVDIAFTFVEGKSTGDTAHLVVDNATIVIPDEGTAPPTRNGWFWVGTETFVLSRNAFVDKDSLQPHPVTYLTHYASVGSSILNAGHEAPSDGRTYGSEWCERSLDPALNGGFDCDATRWTSRATPGRIYQLRDIDCYDASLRPLRDAGVGWGILTATACEP